MKGLVAEISIGGVELELMIKLEVPADRSGLKRGDAKNEHVIVITK